METFFNAIGSISLLIIAIFICVAFYYLIKILKDVSKMTNGIREKSEQFAGLAAALISMVEKKITSRKKKK